MIKPILSICILIVVFNRYLFIFVERKYTGASFQDAHVLLPKQGFSDNLTLSSPVTEYSTKYFIVRGSMSDIFGHNFSIDLLYLFI